ncbi:MAG: hypothetical protein LBB14_03145 [Puniceicoccales bacterium]|jgi:predicted Zn-dependent protease|nr:hypothetical protein [Puniceicoccales bacterium]
MAADRQKEDCAIPEEFADAKAEWLQLLMAMGYVACGQGRPSQAATIFDGIAAVRPNSELPLIGLAIAQINLGKLTLACETLVERAARLNPDNQLVKTVAAMVFRMSGAMEASDLLLDEVIANGSDSCATEFARSLKGEDFRYLKIRKK